MTDPTNILPAPYQSGRLEPCPFCGADAHVVYLGLNYGYVECLNCELKTDDKQMDDAIEDWNRRVNE